LDPHKKVRDYLDGITDPSLAHGIERKAGPRWIIAKMKGIVSRIQAHSAKGMTSRKVVSTQTAKAPGPLLGSSTSKLAA
jgi:hypothetical protein